MVVVMVVVVVVVVVLVLVVVVLLLVVVVVVVVWVVEANMFQTCDNGSSCCFGGNGDGVDCVCGIFGIIVYI